MSTITKIISDGKEVVILHPKDEEDDTCELCGVVSELRPYGPNNERICFDCSMKDEPATARKFGEYLSGSMGSVNQLILLK